MTKEERQAVHDCYAEAMSKGMYNPSIYMAENSDEYWAEGCQSWFDATVR